MQLNACGNASSQLRRHRSTPLIRPRHTRIMKLMTDAGRGHRVTESSQVEQGPGTTCTSTGPGGSRNRVISGAGVLLQVSLVAGLAVLCYQLSVVTPHVLQLSHVAAKMQPEDIDNARAFLHTAARVASYIPDGADGIQLLSGSLPAMANAMISADYGAISKEVTKIMSAMTTQLLEEQQTSPGRAGNKARRPGNHTPDVDQTRSSNEFQNGNGGNTSSNTTGSAVPAANTDSSAADREPAVPAAGAPLAAAPEHTHRRGLKNGAVPKKCGSKTVPHSDHGTAATACSGVDGTVCHIKCSPPYTGTGTITCGLNPESKTLEWTPSDRKCTCEGATCPGGGTTAEPEPEPEPQPEPEPRWSPSRSQEESCSSHKSCPWGQYCDSSNHCYRCSYVAHGACDAIDGNCCSSPFFDQCSGDPVVASWGRNCSQKYPCTSHQQCGDGLYCAYGNDNTTRCTICDEIGPRQCEADPYAYMYQTTPVRFGTPIDHGCCSPAFVKQCGDIMCGMAPSWMRGIATVASASASFANTLAPLHPPSDDDDSSWNDDGDIANDGGLLLGFLRGFGQLLDDQTRSPEWITLGQTCSDLADQLLSVDFSGEHNGIKASLTLCLSLCVI
eukprot:SAG22_NODE_1649_length_3898_cov_3.561990_3_plen_614_part_00